MALVNIPDRIQTKYEHVREALLGHIHESGLQMGDRLPSERELAELTGLNRLTVRRAIKSLCEDGIVRQVPKSGTFVNRVPALPKSPAETAAHCVADDDYDIEGSFFQTTAKSVLRFHIEDIHAPQQQAWNLILAEFERRQPSIRVEPVFADGQALQNRPEDFDVALCIPRYINRIAAKQGLFLSGFSPTWFDDHPLSAELLPHLDLLVQAAMGNEISLPGVPIMYDFAVLFTNRKLIKEPLPDHASFDELLGWVGSSPDTIYSPFTQATLNALMRVDRDIISEDAELRLDSPECRSWIAAKQRLLELQPMLSTMAPGDIVKGFYSGGVAACDLYANHLCWMPDRFKSGLSNLGVVLPSLSPQGCAQIMPRYLVILGQGSPQALAFANFMACPEAQRILAENHLGVPLYLADGIEAFCEGTPLLPAQIRRELSRLGGAFSHPLFISGFQTNMLNPLLRMHVEGSLSVDQLIHQLKHLSASWMQ